MVMRHGTRLREKTLSGNLIPFIGVYDVFSASMAARHYDSLFISGFGFAASYYGLPDVGFITWSDMVAFVHRIRTVLPNHHLLIDIDDGYCDIEVACHVVSQLEAVGASGAILEDQKRPRRCGHYDGKQLMELDEFLPKLRSVLETRKDLFVVARTDTTDDAERVRRAVAFAEAGADAVLVEAITDLAVVRDLRQHLQIPIMFNQIAGGKSPAWSLPELEEAGVRLVNYSTPCLFAAQAAIEAEMLALQANAGRLQPIENGRVGVKDCTDVLSANLSRRDQPAERKEASGAGRSPARTPLRAPREKSA